MVADLERIARSCSTDSATIKSIVKTLPIGSCLVLGRVVGDLPMVVQVNPADFIAMGETKFFFPRNKNDRPPVSETEKEVLANVISTRVKSPIGN